MYIDMYIYIYIYTYLCVCVWQFDVFAVGVGNYAVYHF